MKIEINPEIKQNIKTTAADSATAVAPEAVNAPKDYTPGKLSQDMWDKRNLMTSLKNAWDSDDTAVISDNAKRGVGIVGDPRIVGDESAE